MKTSAQHIPLLSVTVLNYNYGHFLPTCLDSILKQSFKDFELILINDTSTDNSLDVIAPYLADPRVRLVDHKENKGFVRSLIEGCELSRGKYITVISADDWIDSAEAFAKQIAVLEQGPEVAFVYTSFGVYTDEQHLDGTIHPSPASFVRPGREVFPELVLGRALHHSGTMIRKTSYEAIGGYNPKLRYAVDIQMWFGLCHVGKVACIAEVLYAYRQHGENMTKSPGVVQSAIREVLQILDWSFAMLPAPDRRALNWAYKKAVSKTLSEWVMMYTFVKNNPRMGWSCFWAAAKVRPLQTVFHKMTPVLILRSTLGARGFRLMERIKARISPKTRARLDAEVRTSELEAS